MKTEKSPPTQCWLAPDCAFPSGTDRYDPLPVMAAASSRPKGYLDKRIWLAYLVLFTISVPWYWDSESEALIAGIPAWVATTVVTSIFICLLTAWLLARRWPEGEPSDHGRHE